MLPEVTIIRRLDKQQRVSFSLTQAALILAMGQIPAHNGKEGLASHVIDGVTDRHNLQNPVSTTFVSHLESKVNAAIQYDQTLLDKFYTTPLTVVGGSARLVYENLSSDDQERFHLKLILIVSKPREHAGFTTVKKVDCTSESPEPLLQSRWAKDDYKLVKTQLDGMLNACEAKVLAGLPTLLKK
ncbi:hypothetical protein AwPolaro_04950 [Polaromonas sp.]|nr:hypothetical protein AwPolaro_04950 [Polaromonas sp.]